MKKRLLRLLLERYERSSNFGMPGPWRRAVIVHLDERTFPKEWAPGAAAERAGLVEAAKELASEGIAEIRYHKGFARDVPRDIRITADLLPAAMEAATGAGIRQADDVVQRISEHVEDLQRASAGPFWMTSYLDSLSAELHNGDTGRIGASLGRLKADPDRYIDALTAAVGIAAGAQGLLRIVSARLLSHSKRLAEIGGPVRDILVRADPEWAVRSEGRRGVLAHYGVRAKPAFIQCAGDVRLRAPAGPRSLLDDAPTAMVSEALISALGEGLAAAGALQITTIENETPFIVYTEEAGGPAGLAARREFVIYTGGFAPPHLRGLLRDVAARSAEAKFRHWGDPDAGGLQIWWTLRQAIGRPVQLYRMDSEWYETAAQTVSSQLTRDQRKGLARLQERLAGHVDEDVRQARRLIETVLKVGAWVEQEVYLV